MFSVTHGIVFVICLLSLYAFYKVVPYIKKKPYEKVIRYSIATVMLVNEISNLFIKYNNGLPWYEFFPDATCGLAIYLGALMLFTKNRKLFSVIFFWGFGAILTFTFPDVTDGPTTFRFYEFFISHFLIFISGFYMIWVLDFKLTYKDLKTSWLYTGIMVVLITIPNYIVNDPHVINYFYTLAPPTGGTPLDIIYKLGAFIYIPGWISLSMLFMYLYGLPFYQKK